MLMSAVFKGCVTWLIYFLDLIFMCDKFREDGPCWPPLIREQPRKGPSWIGLRNLPLSYTFRTPKITGFEEILIYSFLFTRTIFSNSGKTWMENKNILKTIIILKILRSNTPGQDVFWTSYIRLIYSLFPRGDILRYFFYGKWTSITIPINSFITEVLII